MSRLDTWITLAVETALMGFALWAFGWKALVLVFLFMWWIKLITKPLRA